MKEKILEDGDAPLPVEANNTLQEICSFSEANVDDNNVVKDVKEDIDENSAPLPNYLQDNNDKYENLQQNVSVLKNVLEESRKKT